MYLARPLALPAPSTLHASLGPAVLGAALGIGVLWAWASGPPSGGSSPPIGGPNGGTKDGDERELRVEAVFERKSGRALVRAVGGADPSAPGMMAYRVVSAPEVVVYPVEDEKGCWILAPAAVAAASTLRLVRPAHARPLTSAELAWLSESPNVGIVCQNPEALMPTLQVLQTAVARDSRTSVVVGGAGGDDVLERAIPTRDGNVKTLFTPRLSSDVLRARLPPARSAPVLVVAGDDAFRSATLSEHLRPSPAFGSGGYDAVIELCIDVAE